MPSAHAPAGHRRNFRRRLLRGVGPMVHRLPNRRQQRHGPEIPRRVARSRYGFFDAPLGHGTTSRAFRGLRPLPRTCPRLISCGVPPGQRPNPRVAGRTSASGRHNENNLAESEVFTGLQRKRGYRLENCRLLPSVNTDAPNSESKCSSRVSPSHPPRPSREAILVPPLNTSSANSTAGCSVRRDTSPPCGARGSRFSAPAASRPHRRTAGSTGSPS